MKQNRSKHMFHLRRISLFTVLLAAFFIVRFDAGSLPIGNNEGSRVLAYATEISISGLLGGTNSARAANGLTPLTLSTELTSAAQMKANDMATKNYWAHVSPDGTQPWFFFQQAGYTYMRAGENLAYGFGTSQSTVDGWMNSPSHRANILGDYTEVGFGIVNVPNYQNEGQQTIVVAHYGTPTTEAPSLAPTSVPTPTPTPDNTSTSRVAPVPPQPITSPSTTPNAPSNQPPESTPTSPTTNRKKSENTSPTMQGDTGTQIATATPVQTGANSRVSVLNMIAHRHASVAALISLLLVCVSALGYALTHRAAFQQAVTAGEHFAAKHPGIDAGIIAAIAALILLTTYGNIS